MTQTDEADPCTIHNTSEPNSTTGHGRRKQMQAKSVVVLIVVVSGVAAHVINP